MPLKKTPKDPLKMYQDIFQKISPSNTIQPNFKKTLKIPPKTSTQKTYKKDHPEKVFDWSWFSQREMLFIIWLRYLTSSYVVQIGPIPNMISLKINEIIRSKALHWNHVIVESWSSVKLNWQHSLWHCICCSWFFCSRFSFKNLLEKEEVK